MNRHGGAAGSASGRNVLRVIPVPVYISSIDVLSVVSHSGKYKPFHCGSCAGIIPPDGYCDGRIL